MWFWWFMFFCNLSVPVILIIGGRILWKHCPKQINRVFGYRTTLSMKNTDTWEFAHNYCGRLWWKIGWILLIPSILIQIPFYHGNENIIAIVGLILCAIQLAVLISSIFPTEAALKKTFHPNGTRK